MILLGAGASKPFGIPTLEEFSQEVVKQLESKGHSETLARIRESLDSFGISFDFEALYSILEGLTNPERSVKEAGPLTAFLVGKKESLPKSYDYKEMLNDLRKTIHEKCTIDSNEFWKVRKVYGALFDATHENCSFEGGLGNTPSTVNIGKVLVTTNYDMLLEHYFDSISVRYSDGFHDISNFVKAFDRKHQFNPYKESEERAILKIHGSIFQFYNGNQAVKTKVDPYKKILPYTLPTGKEMMIYPTSQKEILSSPYFYFFSTFKNIQWSKLLVIGYSFRDRYINDSILENMESKVSEHAGCQLIVINPKVEEAIDNLYTYSSVDWKIPANNIIKYNGSFGLGEKETFDFLKKIERLSDNQDHPFVC